MKNKRLIALFLLATVGLFLSAILVGSNNPVTVFIGYELFVVTGTFIAVFIGVNSGRRKEL